MADSLKKIKSTLIFITNHPLYKKYSLIVIPAACSLLAILIIILITVPQIYKLIEKNQELELLKQKTAEYQTKAATLDKIDLATYKTGLNNSLYALPNDKDIPSAINSILDVISRSGLQMTNFSLGSAAAGVGGNESFSVKIEVTGTLDQIKNLIDAQSRSVRLLKIVGISITNSLSASIQGTIDVLVFYAPLDNTSKTAVDQKLTPLSDEEIKLLSSLEQNINQSQNYESIQTDGPTGKSDPFN